MLMLHCHRATERTIHLPPVLPSDSESVNEFRR